METWKASSNLLVGEAFIGGDVPLVEDVGLADCSAAAFGTV